jgi:acyl-CoA hydrolase
MEQIARYIGGIIDDGSTLQIGLGRVTNEALKYLADRRDIGIHSDVVTDAIIPLLEKGILTGRCKTHQPGKIVTSFAMGSRKLYDLIDRNPLFCFQPMEAVCNPATLAAQHKMVSVTQAFAVDLTGQVCVDQVDGQFYSGLAAQVEFLQGASRSPGGKPIICLASTAEDGSSRIRAVLNPGEAASIARTDVHYVITGSASRTSLARASGNDGPDRDRRPALSRRAVREGAAPGLCAGRADAEEHARLPGGRRNRDPHRQGPACGRVGDAAAIGQQ